MIFTSQFLMNSDLTACQCRLSLLCHLPKVSSSSGTLTCTLAMVPNQNHAYTLGSPPPTLACTYCPRYFKSKSGRTRHIQAKHPANRFESHAPNTVAHSSPIPSLPQPSFHDPSPVPSHFIPSLPPSCDEFNADPNIDTDIEHPLPDTSCITRVFILSLMVCQSIFVHIH